jgi:nicotinamide-nucleotide amidase
MHAPDDATLRTQAERLGQRLRAARLMLVTAESCTGGWIAKTATEVAGSSDWFDCGMVAYSYEAKQAMLGVRPETLEQFGAVSREAVVEMVSGALVHSGATVAVAVTGIAGPGGGTEAKPVGMVCVSVSDAGGEREDRTVHLPGDRAMVRERTTTVVLHLLRRLLSRT